ncbi:MAG: hypothetical protein ACLTYN_12485 [Dysosmobacter welbionis]
MNRWWTTPSKPPPQAGRTNRNREVGYRAEGTAETTVRIFATFLLAGFYFARCLGHPITYTAVIGDRLQAHSRPPSCTDQSGRQAHLDAFVRESGRENDVPRYGADTGSLLDAEEDWQVAVTG